MNLFTSKFAKSWVFNVIDIYVHLVSVVECPAGNDTRPFADPNNCNCYFQCWNSSPSHMCCLTGLNFNTITRQCDYPFNARCNLQTRVTVDPIGQAGIRCKWAQF